MPFFSAVAAAILLSSCVSLPVGLYSASGKAEAPPPGAETWSPGDPIPGWNDYDCGEEPPGAGYIELNLATALAFTGYPGTPPLFEKYFAGIFADCDTHTCDDRDYDSVVGTGYAYVSVEDHVGGIESRGQGPYGPFPADDDARSVGGDIELPFGAWPEWVGEAGEERVCLSRVRPDMVMGVVRVSGSSYATDSPWYGQDVARFSFVVTLADHAGVDYGASTDGYEAPEGSEGSYVYYSNYDGSYDAVWPWADITDDAVRTAVYDRYKPWNTP